MQYFRLKFDLHFFAVTSKLTNLATAKRMKEKFLQEVAKKIAKIWMGQNIANLRYPSFSYPSNVAVP